MYTSIKPPFTRPQQLSSEDKKVDMHTNYDNENLAETQNEVKKELLQQDTEASRLLQDQRQTIALLVSEKASLSETVERLVGIDNSASFHYI